MMRNLILLILAVLSFPAAAQQAGRWRILNYIYLEVDSRLGLFESKEVKSSSDQTLLLTGREMVLGPFSSERIPYVQSTQSSFIFRLDNKNYRAVLLPDMLYIQIFGPSGLGSSTGSGYYVFFIEPVAPSR